MTAQDTSPGKDWTKATWKAIGSSSVILLVFSENANAAPHVKREIAYAYYTGRVIIPLRLTDTPPRRDFLFYLHNVRWFDVLNRPAEEQLEALIAHIKGLIPLGTAISPKGAKRTTATWNFLDSRIGALRASNYRTVGILKWAAIAISLVAVGGLMWIALREPKEATSIAESHPRSIFPDSTVSPKPSPQPGGDASSPAPTYNFTRLGLWQPANVGATPFAPPEFQVTPLTAPAEGSASVTPSTPPANVTHGERAGLTSTTESHARLLPPTGMHQAPQYHHQTYQDLRTLEAQKHAALVTRERDALESQLKEIEAKFQTTQKSVDILATQRDELQRQLEESEARAQTAQKNGEIAASERDALRNQLRETQNRAIRAEKNDELATGQINALQRQLEENEAKVRTAKNDSDVAKSQRDALRSRLVEIEAEAKTVEKNADLVKRQRDALETQLSEAEKRAQLAEMRADLATHQRDALEDQLKKAQEEKAQLTKQNADLDGSHNSASKTQSRKEQQGAQPANAVADLAANQPEPGRTQPPNPGHNAKPVPLTQELDSSGPSGPP
jgi:hypothetical protein